MTSLETTWLHKLARASAIGLAVSIATSIVIGIVFFIVFDDNETLARLLWFSLTLVVCSGTLLAATVPMRRNRLVTLMGISMLATTVGAGIILLVIATVHRRLSDSQESLLRLGAMLIIAGVVPAHNGALWVIALPSRVLAGIRIAVIGCAWATAGIGFWILWMAGSGDGSSFDIFFLFALVSILIIASAAGTIAVPIAAISRANKDVVPVESISSKLSLLLECPKCRQQQELRAGHARCGKCGAGLLIEIEEPRCECGYLLYQLQGDMCPECGRTIPEAQRWQGDVGATSHLLAEADGQRHD